ncbi:MAG: iron-sulfur cluster assembly scaffold protein [Planctomyces sp.]|nr:iron-sulfur cluster assembly scaffold protein [Planctomyces sp.]
MNAPTADAPLWEHVADPLRRGRLPEATHRGLAVNPLCGDEVRLELRVGEGRLLDVRFEARGCQVSLGGASLVCERIAGMSLVEAASLSAADVLDWCGVPLSPVRRTCATLAREALRRALAGPPSVSEPAEPKPVPPLRLVLNSSNSSADSRPQITSLCHCSRWSCQYTQPPHLLPDQPGRLRRNLEQGGALLAFPRFQTLGTQFHNTEGASLGEPAFWLASPGIPI